MRIAVLGTGAVGQALAGKLAELGHRVAVGTRDPEATLARTEPDQWATRRSRSEHVEAIPIRDWPESEVRGREAVWDFLVKMIDAWDPVPVGGVEFVDAA